MMNDRTRVERPWRRRAITVVALAVSTVVTLAIPALAHPSFPNDGPGFPNPQGSTTSPYPAGSRPTLNMLVEFEQDGVVFNGAENTTVDVQVTAPAGWTNPACGNASTFTGASQLGTVVPGWTCVIETVDAHQVLHWHGPQVSPTQTHDDSAQFFTFPVTVPSPATTTSYGASGSTAEGFSVKQVHADGTIALFRSPNDTTRPGEEAPGIVRTVAAAPKATTTTLFPPIVRFPHVACEILGIAFDEKAPAGDCSVLIARVVPQEATGTVQFKDKVRDKTTALGDPVPVRPDGLALLITKKLARGEHSLSAMFTPKDPNAFTPSTSNIVKVEVGDD